MNTKHSFLYMSVFCAACYGVCWYCSLEFRLESIRKRTEDMEAKARKYIHVEMHLHTAFVFGMDSGRLCVCDG